MCCTNLPKPKSFSWLETNQETKRWRTACSSMICWSSFPPSVSSLARQISRYNLPEMSPRWTRPQSLALRMSCRWRSKCSGTTGSLEWLATRPLDVVVHARKTFWSTFTPNKVTWLWLTHKHTHIHIHTHIHTHTHTHTHTHSSYRLKTNNHWQHHIYLKVFPGCFHFSKSSWRSVIQLL